MMGWEGKKGWDTESTSLPLATADTAPVRVEVDLSPDRAHELSGVRAIVTDANTRLGLYVIRALGRAGCRVTALSAPGSGRVIGFASRYTTQCHLLPQGPYERTLPEALEELAPTHDVLLPVSTLSIALVAGAEDRLRPEIPFYIPPLESLHTALNKRATTRVGEQAGLPVPRTYNHLDPDSIAGWAEKMRNDFPLVVKFADDRRSGGWDPADRYRIVRSPAELTTEYTRMHELGEYPLVQEYIEGGGYGFFTIIGPSGEAVATFCHRRLREYPISGGPSTMCESLHDETLVELGTRLLRALNWRGVAMVEFKRDRRTGEYKLLEINPRFWGSLPLSLQCGVNFPVYQAQLALGVTPQPPRSYPIGSKMRFFFPDLLAVREEWRAGRKKQVTLKYVRELLDFSIKDGLFSLKDVRPFMLYLWDKVRS